MGEWLSGKIQNGWGSLNKRFSNEEKKVTPSKQTLKTDDEIWAYDFPKSQLDLMLTDLQEVVFLTTRHAQTVLQYFLSLSIKGM